MGIYDFERINLIYLKDTFLGQNCEKCNSKSRLFTKFSEKYFLWILQSDFYYSQGIINSLTFGLTVKIKI